MKNKTLGAIEAHVEKGIPPQVKPAYDRIVVAGLKIMFDPKSNGKIFAGATQGDIPKRLALITASVINMISMESKRTMPVDAGQAAAITLYLNALDFIAAAGALKIDQASVQGGLVALKAILAQQLKVGATQGQQAAPGAPAAPTQPPPQAPGGMINQKMGA